MRASWRQRSITCSASRSSVRCSPGLARLTAYRPPSLALALSRRVATVEYVFDAARLRVLLGPPYHLVAFNLSGVQAPPIRRQADGTEDAAPYAKEAKFFTERNVLCHDVKVILEGTDKFNNFFGSMFYEDDSGNSVNLGLQLVMQGMAKCVDWSLKFASGAEGLRAAEVGAKEQSLRIWKDWVPPVRKPSASTAVDTKEFYATLAEVRSGDRIMVLNSDTQEEQEVVLSSVRANRMGNARRGVKNEPYSWEAREFCRKYVGKRCLVSLEYTRKISPVDGGEEFSLMQGTIMVESKRDRTFTANLAVMLVEAGLASVAQHRDDDERSAHYDELVVAESLAAQKLVNMHAKTQKQGAQQKDVTSGEGGPKQAISLLPSMKRSGRMQAVVEYVYNGGRFKLYLPKQACFVNFALSLISVPTTSRGRPGDSDEPFAKEVATYARSKVFQRNVTVTVETCDRGGTFIGVLEVNNGLNFAHDLVQRGFAYIRVERFADSGILAMEAKAKADKLAIWEHYVEDKGDTVDTPEEEFLEVSVVEICSAGHFFVQQSSDASTLAWVAEELAREELDSKDSPPSRPPRGALCCAKWCGDWYRAKVVKNEGEGLRVLFVDYGNQDVVPVETLRPMSDSLKSTPPVALECRLAGLACPELDSEYGEMAAHYFRDLTWGKTLVAKVEFRAKGSTWVSLFDQAATTTPTEMQTVSESLLVEGMARMGSVPPTVKLPELMEKHAKDEATAKRNRAGMWRYGDVGGDVRHTHTHTHVSS